MSTTTTTHVIDGETQPPTLVEFDDERRTKNGAGQTGYWLALSFVALLLCLPLVAVAYPPMVDYPNHLARVHILSHYEEVPAFRENYERQLAPIPNLGGDLVILLLDQFFDIHAAGKIFLLLTALLFVAGCHLLGAAIHGRPTWLAPLCSFFFYNSMTFFGFINFLFGAGLFMVALACWMRWRGGWTWSRYAVVSLLVFAAYLSHLGPYVFLGVSFALLAAWSLVKRETTVRAAAFDLGPLVPPLVAFAAFMSGSGEAGSVTWDDARGKFVSALLPFDSHNYRLDALFVAVLLLTCVVLFRRATRVRAAWPTFVTGLVFVVLFLACPKAMLTAWSVDARFVVPAVLLLVLSLRIDVPRTTGKLLLLLLLAVLSLRVVAVWARWHALGGRVAAQVQLFRQLPEGARVYPMFVAPHEWERGRAERAFDHLAHYATIERRAYLPTLFAWRSQQPLFVRTMPRHVAPSPGTAEQWLEISDRWLSHLPEYDYVWSYNADERLAQLLRQRATLVSDADGFTLWELSRQQAAGRQRKTRGVNDD